MKSNGFDVAGLEWIPLIVVSLQILFSSSGLIPVAAVVLTEVLDQKVSLFNQMTYLPIKTFIVDPRHCGCLLHNSFIYFCIYSNAFVSIHGNLYRSTWNDVGIHSNMRNIWTVHPVLYTRNKRNYSRRCRWKYYKETTCRESMKFQYKSDSLEKIRYVPVTLSNDF